MNKNLILRKFLLLSLTMLCVDAFGSQQVLVNNSSNQWRYYSIYGLQINSASSRDISVSAPGLIQKFADLNGDGVNDLLIRKESGAWEGILLDQQGSILERGSVDITPNSNWEFKATSDFNGDGTSDVLMRNSTNGTWFVYLLDGLNVPASGSINLAFNQDWEFQGAADFNGDGKSDVLLRHQVNNSWFLYALDGLGLNQSSTGLIRFALNPNWEFSAAADFTGDGKADMIMRRKDGPWWMYQADGTEVVKNNNFGLLALTGNIVWKFQGAGDFNGDGHEDVLLRNAENGRWFLYALDGRQKLSEDTGAVSMNNDLSWDYVGIGNTFNNSSQPAMWNSFNWDNAAWQ